MYSSVRVGALTWRGKKQLLQGVLGGQRANVLLGVKLGGVSMSGKAQSAYLQDVGYAEHADVG